MDFLARCDRRLMEMEGRARGGHEVDEGSGSGTVLNMVRTFSGGIKLRWTL